MIAEQSKNSPRVISFPPLVFLSASGAGVFLNWLMPLPLFPSVPLKIVGGILCIVGTILGLWGVHTFHHAGTNIRPDRPVNALVTDGPFRYSRNPFYIAMT